MTDHRYQQAIERPDLSKHLVHLIKEFVLVDALRLGQAFDGLLSILRERYVRPSMNCYVTRYCSGGAACFYDVPPKFWPDLIQTNPNRRTAFGLVVAKAALWRVGGRPAIYTNVWEPNYWPEAERYRVIYTNLEREPQPVDWMHEREWRVRGGLSLNQPDLPAVWWWPMVPSFADLTRLYQTTGANYQVYVLEAGNVYWMQPPTGLQGT